MLYFALIPFPHIRIAAAFNDGELIGQPSYGALQELGREDVVAIGSESLFKVGLLDECKGKVGEVLKSASVELLKLLFELFFRFLSFEANGGRSFEVFLF